MQEDDARYSLNPTLFGSNKDLFTKLYVVKEAGTILGRAPPGSLQTVASRMTRKQYVICIS